jgi:uncharacterized protein (TIGR03435 family)
MGSNALKLRGTALSDALSMLRRLPSKVWVTGPSDLLAKRIAVKAEVPMEASDRLRALVEDAMRASFGIDWALEDREVDVLVLTAPNGPGKDLHRAAGEGMGHSSEDDGLLLGANANILGLIHEIEVRLGKPLVDESGLKGTFDWDLRYTEGDQGSLVAAMKDQLGLIATPARKTVKMLVVKPR